MKHRYFIVFFVALGAILHLAGYPPVAAVSAHSEPNQATLTTETTPTFSESDYVSDFALSGVSPLASNGTLCRQYRVYSQSSQSNDSPVRISNFALLATLEEAASHRLNINILRAEALVVGLAAEDISFPFNSFW